MIAPEQCQSMAEVRLGVDEVDERIVILLLTRFRFMDAAARIKPERHEVRDEERKAAVLAHVGEKAARDGNETISKIVTRLYDSLVESSIAYEFDRFDER